MQSDLQQNLSIIVREGLHGNHLLFAPQDLLAAFVDGGPLEVDEPLEGLEVGSRVARELASAALQVARAQSIDEARLLIEGLAPPCRAALARLYLRFLARCAAERGDVS